MKLHETSVDNVVQIEFETPEHEEWTQVTKEQWAEIVHYVEARYIRRVRGEW